MVFVLVVAGVHWATPAFAVNLQSTLVDYKFHFNR